MVRPLFFAVSVTALSLLSGCCGGYSVVQTRLESEAARPGAAGAHVLHFARVGEPPSTCGSGARYAEDLFIRVPSVRPGDTFALGSQGVTVSYTRTMQGPPETSQSASG